MSNLPQNKPHASDTNRSNLAEEVHRILSLMPGDSVVQTPNDEFWLQLNVNGRWSQVPLASDEATDLLQCRYYEDFGEVPQLQSMRAALGIIRARARTSACRRSIGLRVFRDGQCLYFHLGGPDDLVAKVTGDGWEILPNPGVPFWWPPGMQAIPFRPEPERADAGLLALFFELFFGLDHLRALFVVMWMIAAMMSPGPYPVLILIGEGAALLARLIRTVIDPNLSDLTGKPREARDLILLARSCRVLMLGPLASLTPSLADAVCLVARGGSNTKRRLLTDEDVVQTYAQTPVVIVCETDVVRGNNLRSNQLRVEVSLRGEAQGVPEVEFWRKARPELTGLLGGLLSAVACSLKNENLDFGRLPTRLTDFAHRTAAAAPALGVEPADWLDLLRQALGEQAADALDASPLGRPLLHLIGRRGHLRTTASHLLAVLRATNPGVALPTTPQALGLELARLAPALRQHGITFRRELSRDRRRERLLVFELNPNHEAAEED